ncbi:unnamed protein product [Linum tenue]|uniref:Fe2OG dioxygenase domain-containing protein n=1 Tax=Linum tenue TaxID=586396 RepID=A0AAV0HHD3_9ROSI|nr:unnamed protein product [Linum tenue]
MAAQIQASSSPSPHPPKSIKSISRSPALTSIPPAYIFPSSPPHPAADQSAPVGQIPTIDFSPLLSSSPDRRSGTVADLRAACRDWGFFVVTNHGVPDGLIAAMIEAGRKFFEMAEEEKEEYRGGEKGVLEPIRCGTSFNSSVEKVFCWKDFLKAFVHPVFHSPSKPPGFSQVLEEYSKRTREVARELLRGISESIGLEPDHIAKKLDLEQGMFQLLAANFYPPCPQPELAMGMAPHSDHCLLTLLTQNGIDGLQVQHHGNWVDVTNLSPNSFLVNVGDQLEILSNGKYKSVLHRAMVNREATRISIAMAHGPSLDSEVAPSPELLGEEEGTTQLPAYKGMKYRDYLLLQQSKQLDGKSGLDVVRA